MANGAIELEGYQTYVPNEVYGRRKTHRVADGREVPVVELVTLERFRQPATQEVLDILVATASRVNRFVGPRDEIEALLLGEMDDEKIGLLAESDKGTLAKLNKNLNVASSERFAGNNYILVYGGVVLLRNINLDRDFLNQLGRRGYDFAITLTKNKMFTMRFNLGTPATLLDKPTFLTLLDAEVTDSKFFSLYEREDIPYSTRRPLALRIYEAMATKGYGVIPDSTSEHIVAMADEALRQKKSPDMLGLLGKISLS